MIKELKNLIFIIIIFIFIFFMTKYYFSDENKKKSYRSNQDIEKKINFYSKHLPILNDDTKNIIEYVEDTKSKKKKYYFWQLIDKNE